jgi:uncharacterized protein (UPF0335 family)
MATELRQAVKDIDRIEADHKKLWDTIVGNEETPWWKQNREEYNKELERIHAASHPLVAKTVPNFLEAGTRAWTARAGLRLARMATGLEIYKAANGKYPASLDALTAAQLGNEPPIDPFSGKALLYRLDEDRYALWSIGPDSADNAAGTAYDPTNGSTSAGDIFLKLSPAQTTETEAPPLPSGGVKEKEKASKEQIKPGKETVGTQAPKRVSNEQEEIVRKKAGKAMADLRSLATAMEAYKVDYQTYAPSLVSLTTPVAYLSSMPLDPFSTRNPPEPYHLNINAPEYRPILYSIGPDEEDQKGLLVFDPTNGTMSQGDIARQLEGTYKVIEDKELKGKIDKQQSEVDNMAPLVFLWYGKTRLGLPENLEEVVRATGYLKEVPEDTFVPGRELSYRLDAKKETARIYSFGPDAADDGGDKKIGGVIRQGEIPKGDIFTEIYLADLRDRYPEIPEPLDRRMLEHIPQRYDYQKPLVEPLLDMQEKENRPNALLYYVAAGFLIPPMPNDTQKDLIQAVLRDGWSEKAAPLKPYIEAWQPAFGFIRKGAALDYAKGIGSQGPLTPVPNFLAAQTSAKALCVEGRYLESLGKQREALENYLTVTAMGRDYMSPGNSLISPLVGVAVISVGTGQIRALVTTGKLRPADLERCRTRLEAIDKDYPSFADAFRVESLHIRWWIDRIRKDGNAEGLIAESRMPPEMATELRQAVKDIDRIEVDHKKIWDHIVRNAETPWWQRNRAEYEKELERIRAESHPFLQSAIPNFLEADTRRCSALAGLRLARVATGLEIYKAANGKYPASLAALTPAQIGNEPPVDPFSGKSFHYRLDGDRYALWSIGPDSADNAAETIYDPTNGTMSQGDIILRR